MSSNKRLPESPPNTTILLLTMAAACCLTKVEYVLSKYLFFSRYANLVLVIIFSVAYIETRNRFVSLCGQHSPIFWNIESASLGIKRIGRATVGKIICVATYWRHSRVIPLKRTKKVKELNHPVVAKIQQGQYRCNFFSHRQAHIGQTEVFTGTNRTPGAVQRITWVTLRPEKEKQKKKKNSRQWIKQSKQMWK